MTKALIIGGGIAGPVTAMALQQVGIEATVHEAYGRGSDGVGAFLTLAGNGLAALDLLGLREPVCGLGMPTPAMRMANSRGRHLAELPTTARTVSRSDLYRVLRDEAVRRGVTVRYGQRLVDAERTATGVRAVFADGSTADGDLLVGADGLRSRTRTLIDPDAAAPRYLGLLNTGGYARGLRLPGPPGVANFVFGRHCFFGYLIHPDGDVWWFANPPSRREPGRDELAAIDPERWRVRLTELLRGDSGPMPDIIAATDQIVPAWATYDLPAVARWHNDRMVLVGDALHAASPSSGQGASMAVEDAVVLAQCLRDVGEPAAAFATFRAVRRRRVERVVAQGKRNGDGKSPGRLGAAFRDLLMPVLVRRMVARNSLGWLYEHRIDWAAPVRGEAVG